MIILFLALASLLGVTTSGTGLRPYGATIEMSLTEAMTPQDSASYAASLVGRYEVSAATIEAYGRVINVSVDKEDSNRNWSGGLRYDRNLYGRKLRAYFFHQGESDAFAGIVQRDSDELGIYHSNIDDAENLWTMETGMRYMSVNPVLEANRYQTATRIGTFYQRKFNPRFSADAELEYVFNMTDAHQDLVNGQIGLGSSLTPLLFIKLNYLVQYQRQPFANANDTSTFTTLNLLAQF
jgi:putative salt-induced outer membrane protein YdiY